MDRGWRAVVQTGIGERRDALDALSLDLSATIPSRPWRRSRAERRAQPVLLTTGSGNPNGASIRFFVDGAGAAPELEVMSESFSCSTATTPRRSRQPASNGRRVKAADHAVTYWQQTPDRRWERKA